MTTAELQQSVESLGRKRTLRSNGWPEWVALAAYASLLAWMIPFHEPWADEAQAWMLARSLPLGPLFHTYLGYEGSPGLWHLFLWCLTRLHVSYGGMHWIVGAIAGCGMAVLVLCSPFPRWMRLSLPFTFFFAYQYAVVARSYVLVPLLLFSTLALWRRGPLIVAFFLGLLGNVALHATVISAGFAILYSFDSASRIRRRLESPTRSQLCAAAGLLTGMYLFAAWTALPSHDSSFVFAAGSHYLAGKTASSWTLGFVARLCASLLWIWFPLVLGLVGWPMLVLGICRSGGARFLAAALPFVLFCGAVYTQFWHAGLLFSLMLGVLWLLWNERGMSFRRGEGLLWLALGTLIVGEIAGTVYAAAYDHSHDYSPGLKTARFLKPYVESGGKVAVTYLQDEGLHGFQTVAIAPYFDGKLFVNQETPFWWWSSRDRTEARFPSALESHPSAVVALYVGPAPFDPERDLTGPTTELLATNGYRFAASFCGTMPQALNTSGNICDVVFTPERRSALSGDHVDRPSGNLP